MNHSLSTLLRLSYVAVGPLLLALLGTQIALLVAYAVAFAGHSGDETWRFLGILDVPAAARPRVVGGCIAAVLVSVLIYGKYLWAVGRALHKHDLRFVDFAQKPLRERRFLLQSGRKKQQRNGRAVS